MINISSLLPISKLKEMEHDGNVLVETDPIKAYEIFNGIKQHIEDCLSREQKQLTKGGAIVGAIIGLFIPKARILSSVIGAIIGYKLTANDIEQSFRGTEHAALYERVIYSMALCRRILSEIPVE